MGNGIKNVEVLDVRIGTTQYTGDIIARDEYGYWIIDRRTAEYTLVTYEDYDNNNGRILGN